MPQKTRTKILATIGPSTATREKIEQLIDAGADAFRFNFSHGTHAEHKERYNIVRKLAKEKNLHITIVADMQGPKLRVGLFKNDKIELKNGQKFVLDMDSTPGDETRVNLPHKEIFAALKPGDDLLLNDGNIRLHVEDCDDSHAVTTVVVGGPLSSHKGVNLPNIKLPISAITEKDRDDIEFALKLGVDWISLSFVQQAEDVREARSLINGRAWIVSKLEKPSAIEELDDIIQLSDAIMVARGDMGVEIDYAEIPSIQKHLIDHAMQMGKICITATQMLDSMIKNPRPTRAETTDVANAIYDGTSAVMLSGESAAGKYPVEAVEMMAKIAERAEAAIDYKKNFFHYERAANQNVTDAVCHAACTTAIDLNAAAVIIVTKSGVSARNISKYRPSCNIIAGTTSDKAYRQLNMSWGVTPVHLEEQNEVFTLFDHAVAAGKKQGLLQPGDKVVIGAGVPLGISGNTNMLKVQVVE